MTTTTLAIINAPTLAAGLVQLLRIGDALQLAGHDCGVAVYVDDEHHPLEVVPDYELPAGVLEYVRRIPVEPWSDDGHPTGLPTDYHGDLMARAELLELLAHVNPDRDLLATADGVGYLS